MNMMYVAIVSAIKESVPRPRSVFATARVPECIYMNYKDLFVREVEKNIKNAANYGERFSDINVTVVMTNDCALVDMNETGKKDSLFVNGFLRSCITQAVEELR